MIINYLIYLKYSIIYNDNVIKLKMSGKIIYDYLSYKRNIILKI